MIHGHFASHNALLTLSILLPGRPSLAMEFVVDTGFVGFLTLPPTAVATMGLSFLRRMPANLADDSTINLSVYALTILWHGEEREVEVLATGRRPLLGTLLLDGCETHIEFAEGGKVQVKGLKTSE